MTMLAKLFARDALVLVLMLGALKVSHALEAGSSSWATPAGILAGMMVALVGYLVHEWGHLLGARMSRSAVQFPPSVIAVFLFKFNSDLNTREQFLWMSMGGFVASALTVLVLLVALSFERLADQVALALTALGVLATFVLEFPAAWRVYRGGRIPRGAAFSSGPQRRAG